MDMLTALRRYGWILGLIAMAMGQGKAANDAAVTVTPMRDASAVTAAVAVSLITQAQPTTTTVARPATATSNLRLGTWSYEVEQMAKASGCQGSGAWLVKEAEGSQHYRMQCAAGTTYAATCNTNGQCLED
ncbi:hypothetical protein [Chitinimonas sp.]|uniref:hypothetical protein n=1 Tax=Chitinimonas sp. TaxID=1934313 RepID=UPI002F937478